MPSSLTIFGITFSTSSLINPARFFAEPSLRSYVTPTSFAIESRAFVIGEIWASAQQTLATGGGCITLSTPYGTGNWFHQTWVAAEMAENSFLPIV